MTLLLSQANPTILNPPCMLKRVHWHGQQQRNGSASGTSKPDAGQRFGELLSIWKPPGQPPLVLLLWQLTRWCNYSCPYCPQNHDRRAPLGESFTAHAFDNYSVEEWITAFERHLSKRPETLVLTGDEPMLDRDAMPKLLEALVAMPSVLAIQIDTNTRWDPRPFRHIDREKLILMCIFHASQVEEDVFLAQLDRLLDEGFTIGQVNYVFTRDNMVEFERRWRDFRQRGLALYPNLLWGPPGYYDKEELALLRRYLPKPVDYRFRALKESPQGLRCLFPAIAYQMDPSGRIQVGCHHAVSGSFFDADLPMLFADPVPCPNIRCGYIDMYSFLEGSDRLLGANPMANQRKELLELDPDRPLPGNP